MVQQQCFNAPRRRYLPAVKPKRTTCLYNSIVKKIAPYDPRAKLSVTVKIESVFFTKDLNFVKKFMANVG
jgi:hypothetical protein